MPLPPPPKKRATMLAIDDTLTDRPAAKKNRPIPSGKTQRHGCSKSPIRQTPSFKSFIRSCNGCSCRCRYRRGTTAPRNNGSINQKTQASYQGGARNPQTVRA